MRGGVRAGMAAVAVLGSMTFGAPAATAEGAFALGDSITVGAQAQLQQAGYIVNAATGRTFAEGLAILRGLGADLPSRVLVNLGSNSGVTSAQCRELTALVGPDRDLTLVTVNIPAAPELAQRSNSVLTDCASAAGARLADWAGYTKSNPGVLCPDGLHISCGGAPAYTRFVLAGSAPPATDPASGRPGDPDAAARAKAAGDAEAAARTKAARQAQAAARAEAEARAAAEAEAARQAAEAEAARLAAEAEAARIAAEEWARTLQALQIRRAESPAEVDVRVSRDSYRFRSLGERLSAVAAPPSS